MDKRLGGASAECKRLKKVSAEFPPRGKVNKRYRRKFRQEVNVKKANSGSSAERKTLINVSAEVPPKGKC
ncbi:hypothetical protein [Hoylesella saccharolytica]|uniref:hypothetical protein n=1 Tax=Hoylesella saccharolytica TaxID=633701 RepID=UPI0028EBF2C2|nr:hypothetical protein [Hoylesella saccharolytica]